MSVFYFSFQGYNPGIKRHQLHKHISLHDCQSYVSVEHGYGSTCCNNTKITHVHNQSHMH
jgi:hypothetical protein